MEANRTAVTEKNTPLFSDGAPRREEYFSALLGEAVRCGYMTAEEDLAYRTQTLALLKERIRCFTGEDSDTVREETAEQLFASVLYCISIALLAAGDHRNALRMLRETPLPTLHENGMLLAARTKKRAEVLLLLLQRTCAAEGSAACRRFVTTDAYRYVYAYDPYFHAAEEIYVRIAEHGIRERCRGILRLAEIMTALIRHGQSKS